MNMIVDAHVHIAAGYQTADELITRMDANNVGKAVLLQGNYYGNRNTEVLEAVRRFPRRLRGACFIDPFRGDRRETLSLIRQPGFAAVKIEFSCPTGFSGIYPGVRLNEDMEWLWEVIADEYKVLTLDLGAPGTEAYQTNAVREIVTRWGMKTVICHLSQPVPEISDNSYLMDAWLEQLSLGELPNVYFDTASLLTYYKDRPDGADMAGAILNKAISLVGFEKIIFGSDIPGTLVTYSYTDMISWVKNNINSERVKKSILEDNAQSIYFG